MQRVIEIKKSLFNPLVFTIGGMEKCTNVEKRLAERCSEKCKEPKPISRVKLVSRQLGCQMAGILKISAQSRYFQNK